jgi:hypothetical protein
VHAPFSEPLGYQTRNTSPENSFSRAGCAVFVSGDAQLQQQPAAVIQAAAPALPAAGVPSVSLHQQIATVAARGAAAALASPKPAVATPVPLPPPGTPRPAPAPPVALPTTQQQQGPGAPLPGHVNPQSATTLHVPAPVPRPAVAVEAAVKPPTAGRPAASRATAAPSTTTAALATARAAAAAAVATARASPSRSPTRQQLPRPATAVAERGQRANSSTLRPSRSPQNEAGNSDDVEVTLLHFNDWHVRVEPTKDRWCALCTSWDVQQGGVSFCSSFAQQSFSLGNAQHCFLKTLEGGSRDLTRSNAF